MQEFLFSYEDKEMFVRMLRACAEFSGIQVLTYAVLDNHFHVLAHVPSPSIVPEDEVLRRVRILYGTARAVDMAQRWKQARESGHASLADAELARLRERMGDISQFMQILKQRFSTWYRANHGRIVGTIWQSRYGSTLVEGDARALSAVAAYIDLNPVRAGIVSDPKDYRWSGYGAACGGSRVARNGYISLFATTSGRMNFGEAMSLYRELLYRTGADAFSIDDIKRVVDAHGRLTVKQMVFCRVRYFTAGVAIGSRSFVERIFESNRDLFDPNRRSGAREIPVRGDSGGMRLCTLRNLRINPISAPAK